jgi:gamma-glutamylputrescine oxidase
MTIEALALLRKRIERHHIDCDWQGGYLNLATSPAKAHALWEWADALERLTGDALPRIATDEVRQWIASPRFHGGLRDPRCGHLHPLKYLRGLARAARAAGGAAWRSPWKLVRHQPMALGSHSAICG